MNIYTNNHRVGLKRYPVFLSFVPFLLLMTFTALVSFGQERDGTRIDLIISGKTSIKDIFKQLQEKSAKSIIYDPNSFDDQARPDAQRFSKQPLSAILSKLGFEFTIGNSSVIIRRYTPKMKVYRSFTGQVTDTLGNGLPGVTLSVNDNQLMIATDSDGRFNFKAEASPTVSFNMIGYLTVTRTRIDEVTFTVVMREDNALLSDVVIVGYGVQKKINLTGAVASVKMDEVLGNRPVNSVGELLSGVIPGFQIVQPNGAPGASKSYNIRGATGIPPTGSGNSISSQGPLILVDNVPLNGPLNLLDPNDIEDVTVLKDAGSAAIYGARSAFGVVLITTKKGKKNQKVSFNYSNNLTLSQPSNLPQKATVLQTLQSYKDAGTVGYWTGNDVDTWIELEQQYLANPSAFPQNYAMVGATRYELGTHDAFKNLLGESAKQFMHNLSVTGGSEKTTYRLSLGTVNENGILVPSSKKDFYNRYNARAFVSSEVNRFLSLQMDASYYNSLQSEPTSGFNQAANLAPYTPLDDQVSYNNESYPSLTPRNKVLLSVPTTNRLDDIRLTGRAILRPLQGLTITGEYTYDNLRRLNTSYDNMTTVIDPRNFTVNATGSGEFGKINSLTDYRALNIFANYQRNFNKHHLAALAGFNQESSYFEEERISRTQPISNDLPSISQSSGPIQGDDNYSEYGIRGYFGRLNYDFDNKYLFEINGRYDQSSKFPENNRAGFFPSVSIGWAASREDFLSSTHNWLNELKFRFSFGQVGNQSIDPYQFVPGLTSYNPYWLVSGAQVVTLNPPSLVSSNFSWETVETKNAGVDLAFAKGRLTSSFDIYQRDTKKMLYKGVQLPAVLGADAPLQNVAELRSRGFELQVNWRDQLNDKWKYKIGANLYNYRSVITKIENQAGLLSQFYVGQQLGELWGYQTDRFYTVDDFVAGSLDQNLMNGTLKAGIPRPEGGSPNPGDILYKDLNGDGLINGGNGTLQNPGDRSIIGNGALQFQYGLNGSISFKNLEFSFVAVGVARQDQFRANILSFPNFYQFGTIYDYQLNYWTPANPGAFYPRMYDQSKGNQSYNQYVQTRYLLNGAYLRIKNLTLNYTMPVALSKKFFVERFQLFASVENPFTFDHLPKGSDPSINPSGIYGYDYPFMRMYSIGANLTF